MALLKERPAFLSSIGRGILRINRPSGIEITVILLSGGDIVDQVIQKRIQALDRAGRTGRTQRLQ